MCLIDSLSVLFEVRAPERRRQRDGTRARSPAGGARTRGAGSACDADAGGAPHGASTQCRSGVVTELFVLFRVDAKQSQLR